jgi:hypothetical protein
MVKYGITRRSRSEANKVAYTSGRRKPPIPRGCKRWFYSAPMKGKRHSEETKRRMSETSKRLIREGKKKVPSGWCKGLTWEEIYGPERAKELKKKLAERAKRQVGEKHPNWKGGTSLLRHGEAKRRYKDPTFQMNRLMAFQRDNYTCQDCGVKLEKPIAHHIIPYRISKDHSFHNLITLCWKCHTKRDLEFQKAHPELYPDARSTEFKPGTVPWNKGKKTGQIPWNKGLTKETDERVRAYGLKESITKRQKKLLQQVNPYRGFSSFRCACKV